ncbi:MAG: hypothetical protein ABFD97_25620 [Syntrophobacter sp.]
MRTALFSIKRRIDSFFYDQRKNYDKEAANAIGTEYVRAELLPVADTAKVQMLLLMNLLPGE